MTKREAITQLREALRERNADSTLPNRFLFNVLNKHAAWLIKREETAGRIYKSTTLFQTLRHFRVREVPSTGDDCGIQTKCKIYRTEHKLPEGWNDVDGIIIKDVTSIDNSISFQPTSPVAWKNIESHPYFKYNKSLYYYQLNGYLFFPQKAPKAVNVYAYFLNDVSELGGCEDCGGENKPCIRFLDGAFTIPNWIEAELFAKALEELAGVTERLIPDAEIDKNPIRKGNK